GFLRLKIWVPLSAAVAALAFAASAAAVPMQPALASLPFLQISDSAAKGAFQTRTCGSLTCYTPAALQQAYDFPNGKGAATRAGQTIVIVTAYGSPTIQSDLAQFDAENGIAAPPSFVELDQTAPPQGAGDGMFFMWAVETSLDVEYAHAMAPGANIVLAVA